MAQTALSVLRDYFKTEDQDQGDFRKEIMALSKEERQELAQGIAKEKGLKPSQVAFPLS